MKSLVKRILGIPEVEVYREQPERYSARVAIQQRRDEDSTSGVRLLDENSGYDPYDTGP